MDNISCKHKWIDMEDGTLDKFCVKCSKKTKQAAAYMPLVKDIATSNIQPLLQPVLRETIVINTVKEAIGKVEIYKDELLKEIAKQFSIGTIKQTRW